MVEGVGLCNGIAVMWSGAKMNLTVNHVTHGDQTEFYANVKVRLQTQTLNFYVFIVYLLKYYFFSANY